MIYSIIGVIICLLGIWIIRTTVIGEIKLLGAIIFIVGGAILMKGRNMFIDRK